METQRSIVDWAVEQFGPPRDASSIAARAYEEGSELVSGYFSGAEGVADEVGDVFIVVCQVAELFNVRMDIVEGAVGPARSLVPQAGNLLAVILAATVDESLHVTPYLRQLQKTLADLAVSLGEKNLQKIIDEKMSVNRKRVWSSDGDGVGQHVPQEGL